MEAFTFTTGIAVCGFALSLVNFIFSHLREKRKLIAVHDLINDSNTFFLFPKDGYLNLPVALINAGNRTEIVLEAYVNFDINRGQVMMDGDVIGPLTMKPGEAQVLTLRKSQDSLGVIDVDGRYIIRIEVVLRYVDRSGCIERKTMPVSYITIDFEKGKMKGGSIPPIEKQSMTVYSYDSLNVASNFMDKSRRGLARVVRAVTKPQAH